VTTGSPISVPENPSAVAPRLIQLLGPGLLFAGAAIGVSHLVQSTRAGAMYGLALLPAIAIVHILKYPALSAGARYAAATRRTLIEGYASLGPLALGTAAAVFLLTAIPIQAVIASVMAVVTHATLGAAAPGSIWPTALAGQVLAGGIVIAGGFRLLDRAMKVLMATLAISTIVAAASVLPTLDGSTLRWYPEALGAAGLTFLLAFLGWMPAPADVAIWNSLWTIEKNRGLRDIPPPRLIKAEFLIGYGKCAVLAGAFVVLGAALIHDRGLAPAGGTGIAAQLLDTYGEALSPALRPLIGVCAVAVMFSTLLSSTDALPRIAVALLEQVRSGRRQHERHRGERAGFSIGFISFMAALIAIATGVIAAFGGGPAFLTLVDVATVASFLATPVLAFLHHRLMHGPTMPPSCKPRRWETALSWTAIAAFAAFAVVFIVDFMIRRLS